MATWLNVALGAGTHAEGIGGAAWFPLVLSAPMTDATRKITASSLPASSKMLCAAYAVIATFALVATWINEAPYVHSPSAFFVTFWHDAAVNGASRFAAADLLMLALSAAVFMVIEGRRSGVRFVWAYVALGVLVDGCVALPLFLIARELRIGASPTAQPRVLDTVLLAALAVWALGLTAWVAFT
jgi:hypothetical protein